MKFCRASVLKNTTYYWLTSSDFQQHLLYQQYINSVRTSSLSAYHCQKKNNSKSLAFTGKSPNAIGKLKICKTLGTNGDCCNPFVGNDVLAIYW